MEFDPYVPIQPTQGVSSTFSPYGAGALPGIPRPAEDWGKILGNFSQALQQAFAAQEPERREEQEAEAARIVLEQESAELSKMLHEAAKKGEIPAGYSPYLVQQVNRQLARKAARELEAWSTDNEGWFNDPEYRATDANGNLLSAEESTPSAVLERHKRAYLDEKYPGLMGTAEGVQVFQPLYDEVKRKYVEKTNKLFTQAQLTKLGAGFSDDVADLYTKWESDPAASAEQLSAAIRDAIQEMRQAYSGLGYSLPEGSLNEAAIKPLIKSIETDLLQALDQEDVGVVEERILALREVNPKGKNEKDAWGFMFRVDLDELEAKAARRKQTLQDRGLTLGDEDARAGGYLADQVRGQIAGKVDEWAAADVAGEKPTASEIDSWLRDFISQNYPEASAAAINVALGRLQGQTRDAINDAKEATISAGTREVRDYNNKVNQASQLPPEEARTELERLAVNPPEETDNSKAVAALERIKREEAAVTSYRDTYRKSALGSLAFGSFRDEMLTKALTRARELSGNADLDRRDFSDDSRFTGLEKFVNDVLDETEREIQDLAFSYAKRVVASDDPQALSVLQNDFDTEVRALLERRTNTYPERVEAFEISGPAQATDLSVLSRPQELTKRDLQLADPGWWMGGNLNGGEAARSFRVADNAGADFYYTLRSSDNYKQFEDTWSALRPGMMKLRGAVDSESAYEGAGLDENKKPEAGLFNRWYAPDLSQRELDAQWQMWSLGEAMNNFDRPRVLRRKPGSADVIFDQSTGLQVPEAYLNWERFPVLSGGMWADARHSPTEESEANKAFLALYEATFYPDGVAPGKKRGAEQLSDEEWNTYTEGLKAWQQSPSGQVYETLPDRLQLSEHEFLVKQIRLWQQWANN